MKLANTSLGSRKWWGKFEGFGSEHLYILQRATWNASYTSQQAMKREMSLLTQGDIMFAINYRWRWDHWQRTFANFAGCERHLLQHSDEITCKLATAHLVVTMKIYKWMASKGGMTTNAIAHCQCYSKAEAIRVQLCKRGTRPEGCGIRDVYVLPMYGII